ncbi:MAG TPA: YihY/virulence factor BrkB family protein [Steroidobacteraceae bacterium]|nr:YihY/virulence factor BrkB family protein [Steroidobacteraceae bacterium]
MAISISGAKKDKRWLFMSVLFRKSISVLACAGRYWNSDDASTIGAALAFYCAFSLAPLLVILLTLAGWVLGANAAYEQVGAQLNALFGASTATILLEAVKKSQQAQGLFATLVSIVTLLIGATTVLSALEAALEQIWKSAALVPRGLRGWLRSRFLSLGFILTLGFLLLISLTVSTALSTIKARIALSHAALVGAVGILDFIISLVLVSSLFALIYRYMPARRLPWKVVVAGGFLTAILFDAGRWAVGLYLAHSTQASAFGAAASFAGLLLWLYYTAQIFLFGAEFTACLGGLRTADPAAASDEKEHIISQ